MLTAPARHVALSLLLCVIPSAAYGQLFNVSATGDNGTVRAGGNSLIPLLEDLTDGMDRFAAVGNGSFTSTVDYAGLRRAIRLDQTVAADGTRTVTLRVPSVGVNRTFSTAKGSLRDQVRDYLKDQGLADLTAFQRTVARQTAVGVVDGTPLAADSLLADAGYQQFALHVSPFETDGRRFESDGGHVVTRYSGSGGVLNANGRSGQYVDLTVATEFHFTDNIALSLTTPFRFHTIHSADVFMGGEVVGLPITILPAKGGPLFWQITPAGHAGLVGSQDLVSGGLIYGGQIDNSFGVHFGGTYVGLANEAGYFRGADLDIGGYHFNTRLDQWQFKNGLQLQQNVGGLILDLSGTWTNFLRDTFTDGYFTPEVGVGVKFGDHAGLRVGYAGHFGNGYTTHGGSLLLYLAN